MNFIGELHTPAQQVIELARAKGVRIGTAESCTGGMVAMALSSIAGASKIFMGGIVAYDNRVKEALLGVSPELLDDYGAVSEAVARAMAKGVRAQLSADLVVSVTGIAGPEGGSIHKPVGTVWLSFDQKQLLTAEYLSFPDRDRHKVRLDSTLAALDGLAQRLVVWS